MIKRKLDYCITDIINIMNDKKFLNAFMVIQTLIILLFNTMGIFCLTNRDNNDNINLINTCILIPTLICLTKIYNADKAKNNVEEAKETFKTFQSDLELSDIEEINIIQNETESRIGLNVDNITIKDIQGKIIELKEYRNILTQECSTVIYNENIKKKILK